MAEPTPTITFRLRRVSSRSRIYLLGLLLVLLQASVGAEQILIWSQHSHKWTKLRGIYGATQQWLQSPRKNFVTSESARDRKMNSLAFNHVSRHIYWHDDQSRSIYRQPVNDSLVARQDDTHWELVYKPTSGMVGGMAVDWQTGNVYYTDQHRKQIFMTRKHPTATDVARVIVQTDLGKPTNIAVDPVNRRLYWADEGFQRIETSNLEGEDRSSLTQPHAVGMVNCLTLDFTDNALYFVDKGTNGNPQAPKVRKLDLHSRQLSDIMSLTEGTFPGIAAHGNFIYLVNDEYLEVQVWTKSGQQSYKYTIDAFPHDIVITDKLAPTLTPPSPCVDMDCGDFCIHLETGKAECRCRDKYYFRLDGRNCISSEPRFLYAQDGRLYDATIDIALASQSAELTPKLLSGDYGKIEALGYHFTKDLAFFSDTQPDDIHRVEVERKAFVQITANEYRVEGITVCWLSNTLYWTDSELRHIMLSHLDGRYHRILLEEVGQPRGITCDALNGYLYFVDAAGRSIQKMYTNGQQRRSILTGIQEPQSIVVDPRNERLYWTQLGRNEIYMSDLDGQKKLPALSGNMPYGVTIFQNYLIWTQGREHPKIAPYPNGPELTVDLTSQPALYALQTRDIVTFGHFLQPEVLGPCLANGGCQQLCFPTPDGPTCDCAIGYKLAADKRSCTTEIAERRFVLFVDPFHKAIYQIDIGSSTTRAVPIDKLEFPVSIDVDPENGKIIWIERAEHKRSIRSSYTNGHDEKELVKITEGHTPRKLAYNSNDQLIYYTDAGFKEGGIYSVSRDGGQPKKIVGLLRPSGIAVDVNRKLIYYAEEGMTQNDAMIGWVRMDGTQQTEIAKNTVLEPSDLAFLQDEDMLFWSDMTGEIWSYNGTSGKRHSLLKDPRRKIISLSVDNQHVYFSTHGEKAVFRLPWRDASPSEQPVTESIFARIYDIKAYPNIVLIPPPVVGTPVTPVVWIGAAVGAAVLLALILLLAIFCARKKPAKKTAQSPPPVTSGFDNEEVERATIGVFPSSVPDLSRTGAPNGNGHMVNGYDDEPDYQNFMNGQPPEGHGPHISSAPELNKDNDPSMLALAAVNTKLKPAKKYTKNKQSNDPNEFAMEGGKVATMVQRLAKRLRTGISSIRWTNGERDHPEYNSNPPNDFDDPGDEDAEQVGCQNPQYKKRPPIGPYKPQLHRLPQGFSPASRVTPSNVKSTWNRNKMKPKGAKNNGV